MNKYRLSSQAVGSVMLALQKALMSVNNGKSKDECDVTKILLSFDLENSTDGLIVMNPPTIDFSDPQQEDFYKTEN